MPRSTEEEGMWLQSLLASALIGRYELNTPLGQPRKKGIVIL